MAKYYLAWQQLIFYIHNKTNDPGKATFECKLQQDLIIFNYTYPYILPLSNYITIKTSIIYHLISTSIKMPNFTLLWKEHYHENLFAINKLSNF